MNEAAKTASPTMEPTLDEQIKYFKFIVSTDDPLGPESAAMHRAILASLRAHADQAADARRGQWIDKLARIRVLGSAGVMLDAPSKFICVELWTHHDAPEHPQDREHFLKFVDAAISAGKGE